MTSSYVPSGYYIGFDERLHTIRSSSWAPVGPYEGMNYTDFLTNCYEPNHAAKAPMYNPSPFLTGSQHEPSFIERIQTLEKQNKELEEKLEKIYDFLESVYRSPQFKQYYEEVLFGKEKDDYELSIKNEVSLEQTEMQMEEEKYDEYRKLYEENFEKLRDLELQVARFRYFLSDNLEQVSSNPEDTSGEEQANYISWAWKRFFPRKKKK